MPRLHARGSRASRIIGLLALAFLGGCGSGTSLESAGFEKLQTPGGWTVNRPDYWPVPGVPLASWKGPDGSSFVVYRELSVTGTDTASIAQRVANRYLNFPGLTVISAEPTTFAGQSAARIEAIAPGTGAAFLPTGTGVPLASDGLPAVKTRRILISIPRGSETLSFLWHAPEELAERLNTQVDLFQIVLSPLSIQRQSY